MMARYGDSFVLFHSKGIYPGSREKDQNFVFIVDKTGKLLKRIDLKEENYPDLKEASSMFLFYGVYGKEAVFLGFINNRQRMHLLDLETKEMTTIETMPTH